jgi:hypothetical protein
MIPRRDRCHSLTRVLTFRSIPFEPADLYISHDAVTMFSKMAGMHAVSLKGRERSVPAIGVCRLIRFVHPE